jgi:hypothetical protein
MSDGLNASRYELPLAALIDATEWSEVDSKSAKFHSARQKALRALEDRRNELDSLYERAVAPDTKWEEIIQVAPMIDKWRRLAAEKLYPQIDLLQQKLASPDAGMSEEVRQARQESMAVAKAWLLLYRDLHRRLLRLAAERRPADVVLRARPIEGEIDHAKLTRGIIARFPNILSELAK